MSSAPPASCCRRRSRAPARPIRRVIRSSITSKMGRRISDRLGCGSSSAQFRFIALGDLSGNTLGKIACPVNLLGEASAYLVAHHGNYDSNVPALLTALRPQVAIMNNGAVQGRRTGLVRDPAGQPDMDLWQLHASLEHGARNAPDSFIANLDEGTTAYWIKLTAKDDGSFEVVNTDPASPRSTRPAITSSAL